MKIVRPHVLPNGTVIFNLRLSDNVIINGFRWSRKGLLLPPMKVNAKGKRVAVLAAPGWWYKRLRAMCEQQWPPPPSIDSATIVTLADSTIAESIPNI